MTDSHGPHPPDSDAYHTTSGIDLVERIKAHLVSRHSTPIQGHFEAMKLLTEAADRLATVEREREEWEVKFHAETFRSKALQESVDGCAQRVLELARVRDALKAALPTDNPDGSRLLLNAYGRRCYDAGATTSERERDALDLKWAAASNFIRDVLFACNKEQPPSEGVVDLPALAFEVLGQIEEWKHESEEQHANCLVENELRETAVGERDALKAALLSIARNSCCTPCQEAGNVAKLALTQLHIEWK